MQVVIYGDNINCFSKLQPIYDLNTSKEALLDSKKALFISSVRLKVVTYGDKKSSVIPILLIKWSILRQGKRGDSKAKILLFSCSK